MEKDPIMVIHMATMLEAKPFVLGMPLQRIEIKPFSVFQNGPFRLVISGMGKANAAIAAAYCCQQYRPACMINLGAAGSSNISHPLGETYQISKIFDSDGVEITTGKVPVYEPHVLEGFQNATLSTRDKPVITPEERRATSKIADLMDMEGAAVMQACSLFEARCHVFKFVSDTPEHTVEGGIIKNIRQYRTPFYNFFYTDILPALKESFE